MHCKVAGLIPSQGTCLRCGLGPQSGLVERQPIDVSLSCQCLSLFSSLPKINECILRQGSLKKEIKRKHIYSMCVCVCMCMRGGSKKILELSSGGPGLL